MQLVELVAGLEPEVSQAEYWVCRCVTHCTTHYLMKVSVILLNINFINDLMIDCDANSLNIVPLQ